MTIKYKWVAAPAPTGPYKSFQQRSWPSAETLDGKVIGLISCDDSYVPSKVKTGNHAELKVLIRFGHTPEERAASGLGAFKWRSLTKRCATLAEAKELFKAFLEKYPDHYFGEL